MIKSRRDVMHIFGYHNCIQILSVKHEKEKSLRRLRRVYCNKFKMDIEKAGRSDEYWIHPLRREALGNTFIKTYMRS
jgi:hypothetical protein